MYLGNLFKFSNKKYQKIFFKNISFDSRNAKKNDIFFSIKGSKTSGNNFINDVVKKRVSAIFSEKKINLKNSNIPIIRVKNTRSKLAEASSYFYKKKPSCIVAVTGTNGKTSVANFFFQLFKLNNIKVASIGTLGIETNSGIKKTQLTTSDPLTLNKTLSELKKKKIDKVILEASSHGLDQKRLDYIKFKGAIFTNFSRDHLDYHKSSKKYLNSKLYLFKNLLTKNSFCLTDESNSFFKRLKKIVLHKQVNLFTIGNKNSSLKLLSIKSINDLQEVRFLYKNKIYKFLTSLVAEFQIKNLLLAILAAEKCGLSLNKSLQKTAFIKTPKGRLECIKKLKNHSRIFTDFAHTPDALDHVLKNLKSHGKNISIVFGCGGDRDKGKRSKMGYIASKYCNKIYVTDDNPRHENPKTIRQEIIKGIKKKFQEISSRKLAIQKGIKELNYNEILLVAGKGHEQYQDFGSKKFTFSDEVEIKKFLKKFKVNVQSSWCSSINSLVFKKDKKFNFDTISINSKEKAKKSIFFAIKGKFKDGHNFVPEAISNGAVKNVIQKKINKVNPKKLIYVKDTFKTLNNFAQIVREKTEAKIIGITGSSGKTTLKNMTSFVLQKFGSTAFSKNSYNNHYGLPLSLSNLKFYNLYGVFELGMSKKGEIDKLSKILKPNLGIITNISQAHSENFKNLEGIAKAKSEIINNIMPNGFLILNRDDQFFNLISKKAEEKKINVKSFGLNKKADLYLKSIKKIKKHYLIRILYNKRRYSFIVSQNDSAYIQNILCSCLILFTLNLNISGKRNLFYDFKIPEGRGDFSKASIFGKRFYLIDESYNANPNSMKLAIFRFNRIKKKNRRKIIFLGDMLELGKKTNFFHRNLAKYINNSDLDKAFVIGKHIRNTYKLLKEEKKGTILKNISDMKNIFYHYINNNDLIMIKGSNATGLNKFVRKIRKNAF